jgi:hypothetical protein
MGYPLDYSRHTPLLGSAMKRFAPLTLLLACTEEPKSVIEPSDEGSIFVDADGDGYLSDEDCDDGNSQINPSAPELCDGVDNDCDGTADEDVMTDYFLDNDQDGYGNANISMEACEAPLGYALSGSDCDDTESEAYPGSSEVCDGIDNDCDGLLDDEDPNVEVGSGSEFYLDADGDGYGDSAEALMACLSPPQYVSNAEDCNDSEDGAALNPDAEEICDGIDNDCNTLVDMEDGGIVLSTATMYYADNDSDGYGDPSTSVLTCEAPQDHVENADDCYDLDTQISPASLEICDGVDNDCDGLTDDEDSGLDGSSGNLYYVDADSDGFGDADSAFSACTQPAGTTSNAEDCDDSDAGTHPGAAEAEPNSGDCLSDQDGDGFAPYAQGGQDCNDSQIFSNPLVTDLLGDGQDQDCDGADGDDEDGDGDASLASGGQDCDDTDASLSSYDGDGDGSSLCDGDCDDADASLETLDLDGDSFSSCSGDCDDSDPTAYPGSASAEGSAVCLADEDGDGFAPIAQGGQDCDDADASTYPGAAEAEENADDCLSDSDGDGYAPQEQGGQDCDDSKVFFNPLVTDLFGDALDQNCDGTDGVDSDGDGDASLTSGGTDCDDGDADLSSIDADGDGSSGCEGDCDDSDPAIEGLDVDGDGYSTCDLDCDDELSTSHPEASEICDGLDNDCDGLVDDDDPDSEAATVFYADADEDGFGDADSALESCLQPVGYVVQSGDCDDDSVTGPGVNPDATESCDSIDNDCDGLLDDADPSLDNSDGITHYTDNDGDGFGDTDSASQTCSVPEGNVEIAGDCNDFDGDHAENCPPEITSIEVSPEGFDGMSDLSCEVFASDADGDSITLSYEWKLNGAAVATGSSLLGGSGDFIHNDTLQCCATPSDSLYTGQSVCSTESLVGNAPPIISEVTLSADPAYTDSTLTVNSVASDVDGHGVTLVYTWYSGNIFIQSGGSSLSGDLFSKGDTIYVDAIATDGIDDSEVLSSNSIEIRNTAPSTPEISLTGLDSDGSETDPPSEEDDLLCRVDSASDLDGDVLSYGFAWTVDGAEWTGAQSDNLNTGDSILAADSNAGELWTCQLTVSDDEASATSLEASIEVGCIEGSEADCPGLSCLSILENDYSTGDGDYWIDPLGEGSYEVNCDMSTADGGWTLVANISDAGSDVWSQFMPSQSTGLWESTDTYGSGITYSDDYKSQAYMDVSSTDILIKEEGSGVLWTDGCWGEQSFRAFIAGLSWESDGSDSNWEDSTGAWLCDFSILGGDSVLRASSQSTPVLGFKWGERDGVQDGNKDRTMITTHNANGNTHHVDAPTGIGGFTSYSSSENYEDCNECQGDGPDQCSNGTQNYQLYVR